MFKEIFAFELRQHFTQYMVYIFFLILGLLVFGAVASDSVTIGGDTGNINKNAPYVIAQYTAVISILGIVLVTAFINSAALRDFHHKYDQILFSTPVKKGSFLFGRFLGGYLAAIVPFLGVFAGIIVGSAMPWMEPELIGPFMPQAYLNSLLIFILPNTLLVAAVVFALAASFRSTIVSFIGSIVLLVLYIVSLIVVGDLDNETLGMMLDPFAIRTYNIATKYWTVADKNTLTVSLSGYVLLNRLLWTGVALAVLFVTYVSFSFSGRSRRRKTTTVEQPAEVKPSFVQLEALPSATLEYGRGARWQQFINQIKIDFLGTVSSTPFIIILLVGLVNTLSNLWYVTSAAGDVVNYPVTYNVLGTLEGALFIFFYAIFIYYSGVLVWKERDAQMETFYDAYAYPDWIMYLAKIISLIGLIAIVFLISIACGVLVQLMNGYTRIQLDVYLIDMGIEWVSMIYIAVFSIFIHVLVNNKYLGYFVIVAFLLFQEFVIKEAWNVNHNLLFFGGYPGYTYSDMNGFGPSFTGALWFQLYWMLFCGLLSIGAILFWIRGKETQFVKRLQIAQRRFTPELRNTTVGIASVWLLVGGFIFYNTNILNDYINPETLQERQAEYERQYKQHEGIAQPRLTSAKYYIDLEPYERNLKARTELVIKNKTNQPIDSLHFTYSSTGVALEKIELLSAEIALDDPVLGDRIYRLAQPLQPGDSMEMTVYSAYESRGFENGSSITEIVKNGTFFNNGLILPSFGYDKSREIADRQDRKDYDLPKRDRMPLIDDEPAWNQNYITDDADWVHFETVMRTALDQIAVAPGTLVKEWEENGKRYFHYRLENQVLAFGSFISARYEVLRDRWNDVDVEIYYQPEHDYNVERMAKAVKASLEYYSREFRPYPHKQARIIEFPRYATFAQAFPGTMPYSESIGFIENLEDEDSRDRVLHVVAHEMAHQWWAHQVIGADVQGATLLSETMAQYASLMVMKREKNEKSVRDYRRYEVDNYLRSRGSEEIKEVPLWLVENMGYIHYQKGSNVMYALQNYIGEEKVNQALQDYAQQVAYQEPPYTTSRELMTYFRAVTPDSLQSFVTDLFERITLYSNQTKEASYQELENGKYQVNFTTASKKFYADSLGAESEVPINDWIDIGVYAEDEEGEDELIYIDRRKITKEDNTFLVVVDQKPSKVGIDPNALLVDRVPNDNTRKVVADTETD
ncbi:MAG: M1 family aminopeptidase [Cyclobacteriaceae bacterium]